MTEQRLQAIFKQFDTDDTGFITNDNIRFAMRKLGRFLSDEQIQEIMKRHDTKEDERLSYEEFSAIFIDEISPNSDRS